MFKVCLMGASFDTGNQGVSALAASLVEIISKLMPDARISFFIGSRKPSERKVKLSEKEIQYNVVNYRLSPRASLKEHLFFILAMAILYRLVSVSSIKEKIIRRVPALQAIRESDFVGDIRGGDSFSDIYGVRRLLTGSMPSVIALMIGKELILLPQTYGPYRSWISKQVAKWIMRSAACIISRDRDSLKTVKGLLNGKEQASRFSFCPDVAFFMPAALPQEVNIEPPLPNETRFLVGLNINGLLYNGGYTRSNMFGLKLDYAAFAHVLAERILKDSFTHLFLVPHTFTPEGHIESDPEACRRIFDELRKIYPGRIHLLRGEYDQSEVKGIIRECDFFIGSRMHACIAALSQGIPTVGVAYSSKFFGVFDSVGVGDMVVDARSIDMDEAIEIIIGWIHRSNEIRTVIQEKALSARRLTEETFKKLFLANS